MKKTSYLLLLLALSCCIFLNQGCNNSPKKDGVQSSKASTEIEVKDTAAVLLVGDKAADFEVEMLSGEKISLSSLKGKIVLLTFWATWCPPCNEEFKALPEKIVNRFKGEEFVLLPISRGEERAVVEKKMTQFKEMGIDFPVGLDPQRAIYNQYAKSSIPRNFLIDRDGTIIYSAKGYDEEHFDKLINLIESKLKK
jgi:peroxiredoxin